MNKPLQLDPTEPIRTDGDQLIHVSAMCEGSDMSFSIIVPSGTVLNMSQDKPRIDPHNEGEVIYV